MAFSQDKGAEVLHVTEDLVRRGFRGIHSG